MPEREFPRYTKVILSKPPASSQSKRCISCSALWPDHQAFAISPCCAVTTTQCPDPPERSWHEAKKFLLTGKFDRYYKKLYQGLEEEQQIWAGELLPVNDQDVELGMDEISQQIDKLTK